VKQARTRSRGSRGGTNGAPAIRGPWLALLVMLALALAAVGCGGDEEQQAPSGGGTASETEEPKELRKIKFRTNFVAEGNNAAFFYATAKGYFAEEGLEVEVMDGKGSGPTAQDVDAGNIEFGKTGSITLMQANATGAELVSVSNINGRNSFGLIVDEDSPIDGIEDLAGKTVIVSAGSPETIYLPAALRKAGVNPDDVKLLAVDASAKTSVYSTGKGDALATNIPFGIPIIQAQRKSKTIPFGDIGAPFPNYSIVTRKEFLEKEPEVVKGFLRAIHRAQAEAADDAQGAVDAMLKERPTADPAITMGQFEAAGDFTCSEGQSGKPQGYHSPEEWEAAAKLLSEFGDVDPFDVTQLYTNEFVEEVSTFATC
jgi:NitT/TauT family transport system substrate-binding protein